MPYIRIGEFEEESHARLAAFGNSIFFIVLPPILLYVPSRVGEDGEAPVAGRADAVFLYWMATLARSVTALSKRLAHSSPSPAIRMGAAASTPPGSLSSVRERWGMRVPFSGCREPSNLSQQKQAQVVFLDCLLPILILALPLGSDDFGSLSDVMMGASEYEEASLASFSSTSPPKK